MLEIIKGLLSRFSFSSESQKNQSDTNLISDSSGLTLMTDCDPLSNLFQEVFAPELDALASLPADPAAEMACEAAEVADRLDLFVIRSTAAPAHARWMFGGKEGGSLEEAYGKWLEDV